MCQIQPLYIYIHNIYIYTFIEPCSGLNTIGFELSTNDVPVKTQIPKTCQNSLPRVSVCFILGNYLLSNKLLPSDNYLHDRKSLLFGNYLQRQMIMSQFGHHHHQQQ